MSIIPQHQHSNSVGADVQSFASSLSAKGFNERVEFRVEFIDEASKEIFQKKEHALIGISPSNGYYSTDRIEKIIKYFFLNKINFSIFLGQGMSYFNFLALGYSEKEAKKKTLERDQILQKKVDNALLKHGIPSTKIIDFKNLQKTEIYKKYFDQYRDFITQESEFIKLTDEISRQLQFNGSRKNIIYPEIARNYFLAEMPLLLNSPDILGVSSSCFIYHQNNSLYEYLFIKKQMHQSNQALCFIQV